MFRPLVAALPAEIRPTVVTYPSDRHLTYQELLPYVKNALPQSEPFILLGESFSGPLAAMIASERPENLIGLILCASFVTGPIPYIRPAVRIFARTPIFRFFPVLQPLKALLEGHATPELRRLFVEANSLVGPEVMAARVRIVFDTDASAALRSCNVPMLCIAGAKDFVVPRRNLRLVQRIKPDVQSVIIDAPHMVLQTRPAESAAAISAFVSSLCEEQ